MKESGTWGTMQPRFIKLENNFLKYYKSDAPNCTYAGRIHLYSVADVYLAGKDKKRPGYGPKVVVCVHLKNNIRIYRFQGLCSSASQEAVAMDWCVTMKASIPPQVVDLEAPPTVPTDVKKGLAEAGIGLVCLGLMLAL